MGNFLAGFAFDYPRTWLWLRTLFFLVACFFIFMSIPNTPIANAAGISSAQKRISALQNAIFWECRVLMTTKKDQDPEKFKIDNEVFFGTFLGISDDGKAIVQTTINDRYQTIKINLADIIVSDVFLATTSIGSLKNENVRMDVYKEGNDISAVIWVKQTPINLALVESGAATPEKTPPTDIVDKIFAAYYWQIFKKGGGSSSTLNDDDQEIRKAVE